MQVKQVVVRIGFGALLLCGCTLRSEMMIAENGQSGAEIIFAENPARMTKLAVRELQDYIKKISGVELPALTEPGNAPVKIYVGVSRFTDALGLSTQGLAHGAFRMASGTNWLALLGPDRDFVPMEPYGHHDDWNKDKHRASKDWDTVNEGEYYGFPYYRMGLHLHAPELGVWLTDDAGTLNAVYEYLRSLGVRWYFPGELGEIVPEMKSIPLPETNRTVAPDFPMRRFGYWSNTTETILWNLRLGANFGQEMMGLTQNCHGSKWVYLRDEVKKAHPDWYSLKRGKRATDHSYGGAPCFSSEGLFQQNLKFARMMFDVRNEPMLSLDACDGYGSLMCECPLCQGLGTPERGGLGAMSDYVWGYVNRVATELYKTHPDRKVSGLSYSSYRLPPEKIDQLSPNLALVLCQTRSNFYDDKTRDENRALRQDWLAKLPSKEMYIYDYYLQSRPSTFAAIPVYFLHLIAEDLRSLKGISKGDMIEVYQHANPSQYTWHALAVMHLNLYVTSRLWWDADQDLDSLLDEFYTLFYGPAAKEMKTFIEYSEANWPMMMKDAEVIAQTLTLLSEAQRAAGNTIYGTRVDLVADYCKPLKELETRLGKGRVNVPQARALPSSMKGEALDGNLDDKTHWPAVRVSPLYDVETGVTTGSRRGQNRTTFQVFWGGDDALYFGIRCSEPDMTNLNVTATQNDDPAIWAGDYIELLIETQTHSYYRIAVNPAGVLTDVDMSEGGDGNLTWASQAEAAVQHGPDGWTVEVRVPWAEMARDIDPQTGIDGRKPSLIYPWSINVCRQRVRGDKVERAAWSPTGTTQFDDVSKFGTVFVK